MAGGLSEMQVDHFDPTLPKEAVNLYHNLMLSTGLCNNHKNRFWPTKAEQRLGMRFLNPTKEMDYGKHIFEDPETHELIGTTPAGSYHIDMLDLNNESFVFERRKRAEYIRIKRTAPAQVSGSFREFLEMFELVEELMDFFIPEIPRPPAI